MLRANIRAKQGYIQPNQVQGTVAQNLLQALHPWRPVKKSCIKIILLS